LKIIKAAWPSGVMPLCFFWIGSAVKKNSEVKTMSKRIGLAFCFLVAASVTVVAQAPRATLTPTPVNPTAQEKKSLYTRLGGYDAIAAVTDDFIGRMVADKKLARFFVGHSQDSLKKIRMHVINQLCEAAGGPCNYTGRDMKTSHQGLGITGEEWDMAAKHLVDTLNKFKVGKAEQDELLAVVSGLRKDIVEK
jgi:hemoglobin